MEKRLLPNSNRIKKNENPFSQRVSNHYSQAQVEMVWLMWATCNSISHKALNNPLLDMALRMSGVHCLPNRHTLYEQYLLQLDLALQQLLKTALSPVPSVSITSDGWSDRLHRQWIDISISFIGNDWEMQTIHPGLIPVDSRCTSSVLLELLKSTLNEWIPTDCLIATCTTDGGAKDKSAAENLVQPGNNIHCGGHLANLCVTDVLHSSDPADAPFGDIIRKAHDLVVNTIKIQEFSKRKNC